MQLLRRLGEQEDMPDAFAAVMAQISRRDPTPAPIPDPPLVEHYVFESPWGLAIGVVALGLAGWFTLRRADRPRWAGIVALGSAAAAGLVLALAATITTAREEVVLRTRELIAAVARADADAVGTMLGERLSVRIGTVVLPWDRDAVVLRVRRDLAGMYRLKDGSATIRSMRASGAESPLVTQCRVTVVPEATAFPTGSWWRMTWRREGVGGPWLVSEIDLQQIDGAGPNFTPQ
jgi:hypothetical protein